MYELHIYTMGTRDYAEAVAKEIDPEGLLFKERILSRDESGSKYKCFIFINLGCLHTSIQRCDTEKATETISL